MHLTGNGHLLRTALRRRARRLAMGTIVFGSIGAALGFVVFSADGSVFLGICGALFGALVGGSLAHLVNEHPPEALKTYAAENSVGLSQNDLPPVTPMLLQPYSRTKGFAFGTHRSGFEGRIGVFNFVRPYRMYFNAFMQLITRLYWPEAKGIHMLVAVSRISGTRDVVPVLLCERRYGGRLLDSVEEVARGLRRVHLESVELDRQYEVFTHPRQEQAWIRRLFSPSFVLWMSGELTQEISFEIFDDWVAVAAPLRTKELTVDELERVSELAARIQTRIVDELVETNLARPPALTQPCPA